MKGKRFSEGQIIGVLKEAEPGVKTGELCRRRGITEQTYYHSKSNEGGLEVSEMTGGSVIEIGAFCLGFKLAEEDKRRSPLAIERDNSITHGEK